MTKSHTNDEKLTPQANTTLAIISIILGVLSLPASFTGLGGFLGLPAIILGAISLAKKRPGTGLSITGVITGTIGVIISLLVVVLFVWLFMAGYDFENPDSWHFEEQPTSERFENGSI